MKPKFCVFCGGKLKPEHRFYICTLCGAEIRKYGNHYTAIKKLENREIRIDFEISKVLEVV